ncbi:hypothetical protein HNP46_004234 [Pseudomonas nitritireducens]|uniref:Uncharacterized protein n=1 Tax=Pseudomonas nitroreducens TaxID=46680 RepID=A0A7W7KNH7_PSENT|nr:hypothetical protein [Pseudomonas nitritireducens]MBB4865353.1 hypothetical protein [Pseudomonas nitritireducens]
MSYPEKIETIFVTSKGDRSVGIPGEGATIKADADFLINLDKLTPVEAKELLESSRSLVANLFSTLWSEPVTVYYDFEIKQQGEAL